MIKEKEVGSKVRPFQQAIHLDLVALMEAGVRCEHVDDGLVFIMDATEWPNKAQHAFQAMCESLALHEADAEEAANLIGLLSARRRITMHMKLGSEGPF